MYASKSRLGSMGSLWLYREFVPSRIGKMSVVRARQTAFVGQPNAAQHMNQLYSFWLISVLRSVTPRSLAPELYLFPLPFFQSPCRLRRQVQYSFIFRIQRSTMIRISCLTSRHHWDLTYSPPAKEGAILQARRSRRSIMPRRIGIRPNSA